MNMINFILIAIIALTVGSAVGYIIHAKRSGKRCIGCPNSGSCSSGKCADCACCSTGTDE